jgi:hypothetical protein
MAPSYQPEALEQDVRALATSAGRMVGTPGHDAAQSYLHERLAGIGLEPYEGDSFALTYTGDGVEFTNLVGVARGRDRHLDSILIGAHYDTAGPYPGADDNAAAVAIALAVAERLAADPAERDVVIALFDAEEPPWFHSTWMGSTWFREHQQRGRMHAVLIMDLVGHAVPIPGAEDVLFITGMESDPGLGRTILARPDLDDLRVVTALNRYVGDMSDHHAYRLARTPYLFLTCGRWDHYHLPSDTPEKLDYAKMAAVAELLEHRAGPHIPPHQNAVPATGQERLPIRAEKLVSWRCGMTDARTSETTDLLTRLCVEQNIHHVGTDRDQRSIRTESRITNDARTGNLFPMADITGGQVEQQAVSRRASAHFLPKSRNGRRSHAVIRADLEAGHAASGKLLQGNTAHFLPARDTPQHQIGLTDRQIQQFEVGLDQGQERQITIGRKVEPHD